MISYPIEASGIITRVLEAGVGDRNILFLHGLGARADRWRITLERYAALGYHCYAFDLPGHGFATKGAGPDYSVPGFANLTCALMDRLGVENAALVGTSLGGHIAAQVCLQQTHVVRGLVLVGAVGIAPVSDESRKAICESVIRTSRADIGAKLRFVLANTALVNDAWVEEEWRINTSAGADESFSELARYFFENINGDAIGAQLAPLLEHIPVQVLWGELDKAVPVAVGREAAALLGGLPLHLIQGAGHAPYFEMPEAFDAAVLPFLDGLGWN